MIKKIINTDKAPSAIGPYSQAVMAGDFLYISGQLPMNPQTGNILEASIEESTEQALKNMEAILQSAGLGLENLVKVNIYVTDMGNFGRINEVYSRFFKGDFPARAVVGVVSLPKNAQIEIEGVACRGESIY